MSHGGPFISPGAGLHGTIFQWRKSELKPPGQLHSALLCLHFVVFSLSAPDVKGAVFLLPSLEP